MADRASAEACFRKGVEALAHNDVSGASDLFRRSVDNDPDYLDALFNLGKTCKDLGRLAEAADAFRRLTELAPGDMDSWYMLGNTCFAMDAYEEAGRCHQTVIEQRPDDVRAATNLGVTLHAAGKIEEAIAVFDAALAIHPADPDLHYNRALALLLSGDFREGWKELEWRFSTSDGANPVPRVPFPRWTGDDIGGKTILLVAEQGAGDTLQFARYIPEVKRRCGTVIFECPGDLAALMRTCNGIDVLLERGKPLTHQPDCWAPLMSLPFLLNLDRPDGASQMPSIEADGDRIARFGEIISDAHERPRVGLVWTGNPLHRNDRKRSCPPQFLTGLIASADVAWLSLQVPAPPQFPEEWRGAVRDLSPHIQNFADTAAAIANLDLVITVDTAVAHLAGSLKKPVWLLIPFAPDWRWMLDRSTSPWYPTMRIMRQPSPGNWTAVIEDAACALGEFMTRQTDEPLVSIDCAEYLDYANALREAGLREHAVRIYRVVCEREPGNLAAWNNLGITLQDGGDLKGATHAFRSALAASPDHAVVMNNLGFALLEQGELAAAEAQFRRAISLNDDIPDLHNNLGNALGERGAMREAIVCYRKAVALRPGFAQAHWNLAQALLLTGEFSEGWREYEWRWHRPDFTSPRRNFRQPVWNGEDLSHKTILIHAEQGFGDALQFVRYVPLVVATGANVILECHAELQRLFSGIGGVKGVFVHGSSLPPFDVHIPLMSLPRAMGTTLSTVPSAVPYLRPDEERVKEWNAIIDAPPGRMRVGFTWSGTRLLKSLFNRACPLDALVPLLGMPGVEFYSLQKSPTESETTLLAGIPAVHDFGGELSDFGETAAAIANLDLVITIDTAVAHLAGALGATTWVLLPHHADWRWLEHRSDSPWYPTMHLFRQPAMNDWASVIAEVRAGLSRQVAGWEGRA
jgi:tetratricopeptide (TPR) repeat protein